MALHGHAKIELHNVKTGETKVIEEKNMLTNWIRDICSPHPQLLGANASSLSADDLFGGIGLYDEQMNENADDYYQHLNMQMIGHASVSNTTVSTYDKTYGVYNENASDTSEVYTKKYVFDWDLEHGNGTISSLGLLPARGGTAGTGSPTKNTNSAITTTYMSKPNSINMFKNKDLVGYNFSAFDFPIYFDFEHGFGCWISVLKNVYYKVKVPTYKVNPFELGFSSYRGSDENTRKAIVLKGNSNRIAMDGRYIYSLSANLSAGQSGIIYKHDMLNETVEEIPFTNTSGETIMSYTASSGEYMSNHAGFNFAVSDKYFIFLTTSKHMFAINMQNNTEVHQIMLADGSPFVLDGNTGSYYRYFCAKLGDNPVINTTSMYNVHSDRYKDNMMIINMKDFTARYLGVYYNAYAGVTNESRTCFSGNCNTDKKHIHVGCNNGNSYNDNSNYVNFGFHYPFFALTTINNLDEPVIKTADMTMRITYTISLEEDEE